MPRPNLVTHSKHTGDTLLIDYSTWTALSVSPPEYPGIENMDTNLLYLMGCSNFSQFLSTLRGLMDPDEHCPFCKDQASNRQIITDTELWYLCLNDYPRPGVGMELVVPKRHVLSHQELSNSDAVQYNHLIKLATKGMRGFGVTWRSGDPLYHAGTIPHLHINIIEANPHEEYRTPFSKTPAKRVEDYARMLGFRDQLTEHDGILWLFSPACDELIAAAQKPTA